MTDWLKIHDLIIETKIGVFDWEREQAQKLWIDLEVPIDARRAAQADNIQLTVDYGALVSAIKNHVEHKIYKLVETVAEDIAAIAVKQCRLPQISVRVKKRSLPGIGEAVVEITRP